MRRVPELDALRGVAALVIVIFHIGALDHVFNLHFGWSAVDLFFILSGYLITTILLQHRPSGWFFLAFYGRRALRIWPIYYLGLFALLALTPLLPVRPPWDDLIHYLTYTQNASLYTSGAFSARGNPMLSHTWTLAIEEQFYLVWPVLVLLAGRRYLTPLALGVVALANAARLAGLPEFVLLSRCDGLALGAMLAGLRFDRDRDRDRDGDERPARGQQRLFLGCGAAGLAYLAWFELCLRGPRPAWANSALVSALIVLHFGLIGLVLLHTGRSWLAPLRNRRLAHLGQISYGLYFYHNILLYILHDWALARGFRYSVGVQAAVLVLSLLVAHGSWIYLERPLLAFKDRLPYEVESAARPELEAATV